MSSVKNMAWELLSIFILKYFISNEIENCWPNKYTGAKTVNFHVHLLLSPHVSNRLLDFSTWMTLLFNANPLSDAKSLISNETPNHSGGKINSASWHVLECSDNGHCHFKGHLYLLLSLSPKFSISQIAFFSHSKNLQGQMSLYSWKHWTCILLWMLPLTMWPSLHITFPSL